MSENAESKLDFLSQVEFSSDNGEGIAGSDRVTVEDGTPAEPPASGASPEHPPEAASDDASGDDEDQWFLEDPEQDEPGEANEPLVESASTPPPAESEGAEDPIVDHEFFGLKGKASKGLVDEWNKRFTQKSQAIEAERSSYLEAANKTKEDGLAALASAQELQRKLQGHLNANPELAEKWSAELKFSKENDRLNSMEASIRELRSEREQLMASQGLATELSACSAKYKILDNPVFTQEDASKQALAIQIAARGEGRELGLEHVYQAVVAEKNGKIRSARSRNLRRKVVNSGVPIGEAAQQRGVVEKQKKSYKGMGVKALDALLDDVLKGM